MRQHYLRAGAVIVICSWYTMEATNGTSDGFGDQNHDPANFEPKDIITKEFCVFGGCSGTDTAIRVQDLGKSVVIIGKGRDLGGHAST